MNVGSVGYNYRHDEEFEMNCPNGSGCYLMLIIKEPSVFVINGVKHDVKKNSFVLLTPEMPHSYKAKDKVYTDDWIYLHMESGDAERLRALGIPENEIVQPGNIEELSQTVRAVAYEHYSAEEGHELIEQHYFEIFLLRLSRAIRNNTVKDVAASDKITRLLIIRNMIYSVPEERGDVGSLARSMGMSRSGFQHLYKKTFGVTVIDDIINGKMKLAKELLTETNMSLKEISSRCGYSDEYSFMKRFRKYYGKTPTQMKKQLR
jgi:AraC family transcriptional regulator of arabinose operon